MDAIADKTFGNEDTSKTIKEESPSLLTIILDTNPVVWHSLQEKLTLKSMLESLLVGINAHLSLNNSNQVSVIASHSDGAKFLYPIPCERTDDDVEKTDAKSESNSRSTSPEVTMRDGDLRNKDSKFVNSTMYRQFKLVDETFLENLYRLIDEPVPSKPPSNYLSSALSLALTYINKFKQLNPLMKARVLVVNISQDEYLKYIPIMNCIFAAQKMKVPIDVCQLGLDATFLQQAADATSGVYLHVENTEGLVQYFTTALFIEPSLRNILVRPSSGNIDFRASCFLTGKVVDIGYVCSVCLCILSLIPDNNKCPACDSDFDTHVIKKLKRKPVVLKKRRKINRTE